MEYTVREYVGRNMLNVQIYTGTHGIFSVIDCGGKSVDIYLDINKNTTNDCSGKGPSPLSAGRIPVPLYYYKVVLDEASDRGVVIIGLNNPHASLSDVQSGKFNLCPDVSSQIKWMEQSWNRTDIHLGYSYACEVNSFVKVVSDLPESVRANRLLL